MLMRVIHGRVKPGTWDEFEAAYKDVMTKTGNIPGLRGRWLARDLDDPDAGYTFSEWEDEASMRAYESSAVLKEQINARLSPYFVGDYHTRRTEVRHEWEALPADQEWTGSDS